MIGDDHRWRITAGEGATPASGDVTATLGAAQTVHRGHYEGRWIVTNGSTVKSFPGVQLDVIELGEMWGRLSGLEQIAGPQSDVDAALRALLEAETAVRGHCTRPVPTNPVPGPVRMAVATLAARNLQSVAARADGAQAVEERIADVAYRFETFSASMRITSDVADMLSPWRPTAGNTYAGPSATDDVVPISTIVEPEVEVVETDIVTILDDGTMLVRPKRGDYAWIRVKHTNTSAEDFDWTGWTWAAEIRDAPEGTLVTEWTITDSSTATVLDLLLELPVVDAELLEAERRYYFDVQGTKGAEVKTWVPLSYLTPRQDVTA